MSSQAPLLRRPTGFTVILYKSRYVTTPDGIVDEDIKGTGCCRVGEDGYVVETLREKPVLYCSIVL
jgi:hypothetical protein